MSLATRLYQGDVSYDFVARRRWWYVGSGIIIAIGLASLLLRGFNLGIDFKGGDAFQFKANGHTVAEAKQVLTDNGIAPEVAQQIGENQIRITTKPLSQEPGNDQVSKVQNALAARFGLQPTDVSPQSVGASWGSQITTKAIEGLVIFLLAVIAYITLRFTGKMAVAAIVALVHDLVITAGIYSLVGFEVTPSTVIALLTILGFSLYDTVVVFDKVRENTAGLNPRSTQTYTQSANLAVNQTLMRSINTSLIALLPVAALLFVGAGLLGAGTLKDLALAQFIGLAAGAYSSIFIATPLLVQLKEREPAMRELTKRVAFLSSRPAKSKDAASVDAGTARQSGRTATAVLEREAPGGAGEVAGPAGGVAEPEEAPGADVPAAGAAGPLPTRVPGSPMVRQDNRRRSGGRGRRPSGKRRR